MQIGFTMFRMLAGSTVHEVFPSASYALLSDEPSVRLSLTFSDFLPGPKDMLDAICAAYTVREFEAGRGCAVGGGDGLGRIVLPRPLRSDLGRVGLWPDAAISR